MATTPPAKAEKVQVAKKDAAKITVVSFIKFFL
jgi:hypothetical protein